jgi:hypothetical protein
VEISDGAVTKCNYELRVEVVNKSSLHSLTHTRNSNVYFAVFSLSNVSYFGVGKGKKKVKLSL